MTLPGMRTLFASLRGSLRTRVVVFLAALVVLVQAVSMAVVYVANHRIASAKVAQELDLGERLFERLIEQSNRQFTQAAAVLSKDFGFREAISTRDVDTIRSVLLNHGARIGARVSALASLEGEAVVDSLDAPAARWPFAALVAEARATGKAAGIVLAGGRVYQATVVPVLAPAPIAWAVFGFEIDDPLARELKELSALDVSFAARDAAGRWEIVASTADPEERAALRELLSGAGAARAARDEIGGVGGRVVPLGAEGQAAVVLQRSLQDVLAPFVQLERVLLFLALGSIVAAGLGGLAIAGSITRPVSALAEGTRRIEEGDYTQPLQIDASDEIGQLARRFDQMREGIARREEQITHLAYRDVLTGLPNRTLFNDRLRVALEAARRGRASLAVMILDLDRFKNVNDTLGHHVGDQLLQQVGQRLEELLRKSDSIARLGGDEFALLLPDTDIAEAHAVAHKIDLALAEPIVLGQQAIDIRASVGAAVYPEHGDNLEELLRHADAAMYTAKRANTGFASYDATMQGQREEHLSLLSDLRRAIDNGELRLVYQPKLDLASGQVAGAEALLRWVHPRRGPIPPVQFIPFAEQTGFIKSITRWVLEEGVRQAAAWRAAGHPVKVSVNISAQDLLHPELLHIVSAALERHALTPALLCLEITESDVMRDAGRAMRVLRQLAQLGVGRAIDDFGTGYSSLAYVKQLSVDELKIDQSFVRHLVEDRKDRAIVLSTIELAHNLDLQVVAEGVEDEPTFAELGRLGCDQIQGYFISRPLEVADFEAWRALREPLAVAA
jgi:diguanylate cyclase (GGDEF)-like protein